MVDARTRQNEKRLLEAISSLKRAAGIAGLVNDCIVDGKCRVFTEGIHGEGEHLLNVLNQALMLGHTPQYWRKRPGKGLHDQLEIKERDCDLWEVSFPVSESTCNLIADRIQKMTQILIGPDIIRRTR